MRETAATWARRVREWKTSGDTAAKFSEAGGFSEVGLRNWSYRLKRAKDAPPSETVRMVRVERALGREKAAPRAEDQAVILSVEVGGARVAVTPGFDRATLAAIVDVLHERQRRSR